MLYSSSVIKVTRHCRRFIIILSKQTDPDKKEKPSNLRIYRVLYGDWTIVITLVLPYHYFIRSPWDTTYTRSRFTGASFRHHIVYGHDSRKRRPSRYVVHAIKRIIHHYIIRRMSRSKPRRRRPFVRVVRRSLRTRRTIRNAYLLVFIPIPVRRFQPVSLSFGSELTVNMFTVHY